jgi:putative transposase
MRSVWKQMNREGIAVARCTVEAETINGLCKAELIHRRAPWKTRESVELATLQWVHWFNRYRLLESIGYIPPADAEANYWQQQASETRTTVST